MFGRRNPDRPSDNQTMPLKSDLDLDMLDDLPDILPDEPAKPAAPPAAPAESRRMEGQTDPAPDDPAWQAAAPPVLGPSVTQLLREAEATPQPPANEEAPSPFERAPAITTQLPSYIRAGQPETQAAPPAAAPAHSFASPSPGPVAPAIEQPAAPRAPLAPAAPTERPRVVAESVIGPDDFFDGRYRSERGVRIQGNARGSIESRQYIYVEAGAQVEADLSAEEITIAGDFTGRITCRGRLEVTSEGKVQGHVDTTLLVVHEGGAIDGELNMRGHDTAATNDAALPE